MMAFPRKFKHLLEIDKGEITTPSHVYATYCVCAINDDSCGWGGWTLEAVFSDPKSKAGENLLHAQTDQVCPDCGGQTFRTAVSYRFDFSSNQSSPISHEYDTVPIKYTDK